MHVENSEQTVGNVLQLRRTSIRCPRHLHVLGDDMTAALEGTQHIFRDARHSSNLHVQDLRRDGAAVFGQTLAADDLPFLRQEDDTWWSE